MFEILLLMCLAIFIRKLNAYCIHTSLELQFSLNLSDDPKEGHYNLIERAEIAQLVRSRMQSLGKILTVPHSNHTHIFWSLLLMSYYSTVQQE